jgi:phosphatidylinositol glycan class T
MISTKGSAGAFVEKMHVFPSKDKISPGMMEIVLKLPCGVKSAALILEFDKVGFSTSLFSSLTRKSRVN